MSRARTRLVIVTALFALYLPSSVAGVISPALGAVGLVGTCSLLLVLLVQRHGVGRPVQVVCAVGMLTSLGIATGLSPLEAMSPGLVPIFLSLAYLVALRLTAPSNPVPAFRALKAIHIISLVAGYALVANLRPADQFFIRWYSAFYPELLSNMLMVNDKPVLTFGTHSMAGFMVYLFFYTAYTSWRVRDDRWSLAVAIGHIGLLIALTSTTSLALGTVAAGQLVARLAQRNRWAIAPTATALVAAGIIWPLALGYGPAIIFDVARDAVLGDRVRGLMSRYAAEGLLAANFQYLSEHPLRPIGIGFSKALYLGDSGLLLTVMRGSLPLALFAYGGWYSQCAHTIRSRAMGLWLTIVTVVFEVGFTPLQYFRFVGVAPLLLVCLEALNRPDEAPPRLEV